MERRRVPTGILVLGALAFSAGFWRFILSSYALWISIRLILFGGAVGREPSVGFDLMCAGAFGVLLALAWFVVSDALFNLRTWAWQLGVILSILNLLFTGLELLVALVDPGRGNFPWGSVISLGINGFLLWYLMRPEIRGVFALRGEEAPPDEETLDEAQEA